MYGYYMRLTEIKYIVAVDGGGSTCRASVADLDGNVLGRARGQSANLNTDFDASRANIIETVRGAYRAAGLAEDRMAADYAYFGLAGASIGKIAQQLEGSLDFHRIKVVTDREITVQGALGDGDGTVVLMGTGSFFARRMAGACRNIGGWGFRLCDDGGGAYLGMALMRRTIQAFDGRIENSPLTRRVLEQFGGTPNGIVSFAQTASPKEFGEYAPWVTAAFAERDLVAVALIDAAVERLEQTLEILGAASGGPLCMLGGLGPFYQTQLSEKYQKLCQPPIGDALAGAIWLAQKQMVGAAV